jgi:hypothetical protein
MKILKQEENYIKVQMADGKIIVIDNSDREFEIENGDGDNVRINIYISEEDMYTPIAALEYNEEGSKFLHMPEENIADGKVIPFSPSDAFNMTAKEWWEDIRAEIAVRDLLK